MATFKIMEIQEAQVYVVVTKDDGSTFGQSVRIEELNRTSIKDMLEGIRTKVLDIMSPAASAPCPLSDLKGLNDVYDLGTSFFATSDLVVDVKAAAAVAKRTASLDAIQPAIDAVTDPEAKNALQLIHDAMTS